jgi:soluble lytic murein transglycosylase
LIGTLAVACGLWTPTLLAQAQTQADQPLLEMSRAFRAGDGKRLAALLPQASGHPLEPWAAYWELRNRLEQAQAQEVQDFMRRFAGSYQEDRLRNDWLLLLGARKDWAAFAAEYPRFRMKDDRELRCYAALIEHQGNPAATSRELVQQVRRDWLAQREVDNGCQLAADTLINARKMPAEDAWMRARLAVEANRPKAARAAVEIVAPDIAEQVGELHANPARYLSGRVIALGQMRKELVLLALIRMAASEPDVAAATLENKWKVQLSAEERNWAWGSIGRQAANRLSSLALDYFGKVTELKDLADDMLAWRARAALRAVTRPKNEPRWPLVLTSIEAMDEETAQDPTWVYWKARALLATAPVLPAAPTVRQAEALASRQAQARSLFEGIAGSRGFYEQLALEELGRRISVPPAPAPLTAEEKQAARMHAGLNRGLYAILIGIRGEGVREWNYSTNLVNGQGQTGGMSERELLAAADLACAAQVWDRCINTSERTRTEIDQQQRYPMPYREAVLRRTEEIGLDPAYVYGLIRQESRFIMDARSGVGASGLMQVMPATARWTARKIGLTNFTPGQITDRDTNIAIGTGYLKLVLDDFAGSLPLAAAAYNAGPGRPRLWRAPGGSGPVLDAAIWAENIPFNETRDYVKKVLANTTNYAALLSGQPQSLKARLGTVGPREGGSPPDTDLP